MIASLFKDADLLPVAQEAVDLRTVVSVWLSVDLLFVCLQGSAIMRGPMVSGVVNQLLTTTRWYGREV